MSGPLARSMALQAELERRLAEGAVRHQVPGAAVGLTLGGSESYAFHGVTSLDNPLPVDAGTLFQIGSTTKTFTATALMRLVEAGRVDLGAPIRTYVPELRLADEDVAARVTVLQLLNHTAGWTGDFFVETGDGDDALARYVDRLAELRQVTPLGGVASYNNAAFSLAGRVIEKVTGRAYEEALRELVLEPLGLDDTFFSPAEVITRRFAVGHQRHGGAMQVARRWNLARCVRPAGGLCSTAADQVRYARFHLGDGTASARPVLSAETLARMRRPTARLDGSHLGDAVGVAWLLADAGRVRLVRHGGTTNGQLSAFTMVPERDFAITVLTNADTGGQLHEELVAWALEAYAGVAAPPRAQPVAVSMATLAEYAGRYRTANGGLDVSVQGDRLVAMAWFSEEALANLRGFYGEQLPEQEPMPLGILPDDWFVVLEGRSRGMRGRFLRAGGEVAGLNAGGRLAPRVRQG